MDRVDNAPKYQQRRHVAHHHGDPRLARLQGGQEFHRRSAVSPSGEPRRDAGGRHYQRWRCRVAAAGSAICSKAGWAACLLAALPGSVLSGGLNDLLKQFQQSGHSDTANSWVGTGPNKAISPNDLASALGADKINALMTQSGMSRDDLLHGLSQYLPQVVDQLTPEGRLPTEQEVAGLL